MMSRAWAGIVARLAWRNLWRNHRRTLIMLAAVTVGVWAMIFMTAMMRGMVDEMVRDGIRALPGHVQVHHPDFRDDPSVVNRLAPPSAALRKALDDNAEVWGTRVRVPAVISSERDTRGVTLIGVDPAREAALSFVVDDMVEGRFLEGRDDRGIVLGRKMLDRLETDLGKRVVVMSQDPDNDIVDRGFRIVGVFESKLETQEEMFAFAGEQTVQKLLRGITVGLGVPDQNPSERGPGQLNTYSHPNGQSRKAGKEGRRGNPAPNLRHLPDLPGRGSWPFRPERRPGTGF
jgi:ABC-type lipoprotein release transport system permease subunit